MVTTGGAALLAALGCLALLAMSSGGRGVVELLDERSAAFRAVGDPGCLGRSCMLSDTSSRTALNSFFDSFLGGKHAGHAPRYLGNAPQQHKLTTRAANDDLQSYYDNMGETVDGRTRAVRRRAQKGHGLVKYSDQDAHADLNDFYDALQSSKRAGILAVEKNAEQGARSRLIAARGVEQKEIKLINQFHLGSEAQSRRDHKRYRVEGVQQLQRQATGHVTQAVPSTTRSTQAARFAQDKYFKSLVAQAHTEQEANAPLSPRQQARPSAERRPARLATGAGKTERVLAAEHGARAREGRRGWDMTRAAAQRQEDGYFASLSKSAHLTKDVRADVDRSRVERKQRALSSEAARRELAEYVPKSAASPPMPST
ncbi:hypothetical protein T484DRAFT_1943080 [Baffinella frigidus]|nr:hypothetical protein T484DRAFT_1943080 [Cryptophyta sp. CCMP2293]|mmetsp:Transcript_41197/g.97687  ORF Transcript_41197/g.97687 Transcript_41197/m.97687 type:complete len:371 (+) Transcript_41197:13-1125(+)